MREKRWLELVVRAVTGYMVYSHVDEALEIYFQVRTHFCLFGQVVNIERPAAENCHHQLLITETWRNTQEWPLCSLY